MLICYILFQFFVLDSTTKELVASMTTNGTFQFFVLDSPLNAYASHAVMLLSILCIGFEPGLKVLPVRFKNLFQFFVLDSVWKNNWENTTNSGAFQFFVLDSWLQDNWFN